MERERERREIERERRDIERESRAERERVCVRSDVACVAWHGVGRGEVWRDVA